MMDNVHIIHSRGGKVVEERKGHNVWLDRGRRYLGEMLVDPPGETQRIKYIGLGIGSKKQVLTATANSVPIVTSYPAGFDPQATAGNEYDHQYPIAPEITTLERPIRLTGGVLPYPGAPGDEWLFLPPPQRFDANTLLGEGIIQFSALLDTNLGDILYGPFFEMPLSEIGLFLSGAVTTGDPYNVGSMVAYHSFVTILLSPGSVVEFRWQVRF